MRLESVIGLIVLSVIGYFLYKKLKADQDLTVDVPYPQGKSSLPKGFNPNVLADDLYNAMNDVLVLSTTKEFVWSQLLNLPNTDMIVLVYNTFNRKYGKKGNGTLTKWISDELVFNWGSSVKQQLLAKLRSLNLK